jgi:hypothetical protein
VRDKIGEGSSTFGPALIIGADSPHYVSYNGKVWNGSVMVYDPYATGE